MSVPFPMCSRRMRSRHDLVAGDLGLVVDHLCRKSLPQHPHAAGVLEAPDDVRGELALAVAARTVPEYAEHQRGELQRHLEVLRECLEQSHVLDDQIHGEVDVAAAVEDDLRLGLVHERVSGGNADRLVGRVHVEARHLGDRERLGEGREMHRAQVVGEDFEHGSRADGPGVQDALAENRQHRQDTLEGGARAAGEDRDITGGGAVTAAGHRAIHGGGASLLDARGELAGGARRPGATLDQRRHALRVQVPHRELDAVAQQVAGEWAADVAQADEADARIAHVYDSMWTRAIAAARSRGITGRDAVVGRRRGRVVDAVVCRRAKSSAPDSTGHGPRPGRAPPAASRPVRARPYRRHRATWDHDPIGNTIGFFRISPTVSSQEKAHSTLCKRTRLAANLRAMFSRQRSTLNHTLGRGSNRVVAAVRVLSLIVVACGSIRVEVLAADAPAAQSLAQKSGCFKCHGVDKKKDGPALRDAAAKYKDKADAQEKLVYHVTSGEKVKFEDGHEEEHKKVKTSDPNETKNLVAWILGFVRIAGLDLLMLFLMPVFELHF